MAVLGPIGLSNVGLFWAPTRLEADATDANIANPPSGPGTPVIVTVDDPFPQQRFKYVAAIAAVAAVAAAADFVPLPAAARAAVISVAWAPAGSAPQRPNENTAAFAVAAVAAASADNPPGLGVPRIVTVPDDPLPTLNRKLPQGQLAADYVPFTRHFEVLGAWEPIRFSLPTPGKIAALIPAPDIQPPPPRHMEVILAAWAAPPPTVVLPPRDAAIATVAAVADVPPPLARRMDAILAAWVTPAPTIVLATKDAATATVAAPAADVPPPIVRRLDIVLAAWAATPPAIVLPPKEAALILAPVLAAQPDNPAGVGVPRVVVVPDDPLPTLGRPKLVPPTAAVQVDNPPPLKRNQDWSPWDIPVPVKLVVSRAATEGVTVAPPAQNDNPPFGLHRFTTWAWGPPVAYPGGGGEFVPQDVAQDTAPITRPWLNVVLRAWEPPPPLPTLPPKFTQAQAQVAPPPPAADNPAGRGVPRIVTLGDDPLPQVNRKLPQAQVAAVPDNPPFNQRRVQDWTHFYPPPPLPTLNEKLLFPGEQHDPAPKGRPLWDWANFKPIDPNPTLGRQQLARENPPQTDNPPFSQRHTQDYIHFKPLDPLPTLRVKLPQDQIPATHDNPPFTQRHTQLWVHWYPPYPQPDPLPTLGRVKQTPPSTDTPVIIPPTIGRPYPIGGDWWHRTQKAKSGKRCRFVTIDGVLTWICDRLDYERAAEARLQALDLVYDAEGMLEPLLEAVRLEEATNSSAAKRAAAALLIRAIHEAVIEDEDDDLLLLD